MAQVADYVIANANGATVRADINAVFLAVSSTNSGTSEPSTMYAFMLWVDTTTNLIKLRNAANGAWITLGLSVTASNTVDINGGAIDGTAIGASSATTGAFTTISTTGTLTVGVNDTGYDVKFFGATSGAYMLWDESVDDLKLVGAAGLTVAGDIDIDGTANLDIVDVDGAVNFAADVTYADGADIITASAGT